MTAQAGQANIFGLGKQLKYVLISSGIILTAAFLFSVNTDLPHVFLLTLTGVIITIFYKKPFPYSDRSIIYSILTALVLAILLDLAIPMAENRTATLGSLLFSSISGPFLLYLAVLITFYESSAYTVGVSACFSLVVCLLGGENADGYFLRDATSWFMPAMKNPFAFFQIMFVIEISLILIGLHIAWPVSRNPSGKKRWQKRFVNIFTTLAVIFLSATFYHLYIVYKNDLRMLESLILKYSRRNWGRSSRIIFDKDVNLNQTLNQDFLEDKDEIAIRAVSDKPPGYLRGRSYLDYNNGLWTNPDNKPTSLKRQTYEGILAFNTFYINENKTAIPGQPIHIYPARKFSSNVLLVPGETGKIDIVADQMSCSADGTLIPEKWMKDGAYTAYTEKSGPEGAYSGPNGSLKHNYLRVPAKMTGKLDKILKEIFPLKNKKLNDNLIIARLVKYFRKNFKYSLDFKNDSQNDPVIFFLNKNKKGHCELFAASMVLLLRRYGIPARYVTGFICEEPHPTGKYYVARVGSAHAWLEARPRDLKKWVLVEPTPPSAIPQYQHNWGVFETWFDYLKQLFQQVMADMRRGYFAKAIISVFTGFFSFIWALLWHPFRGTLFLIVVLSWYAYRRYRKSANMPKKRNLNIPKEIINLQKELTRLENAITKKTGLKRPQHATFEEWLNLLPPDKIGKLQELNDICRMYKSLRFRQKVPDKNSISEFSRQCRNYLQSV